MRYLPDDYLSYTVLLELSNSGGSGFYFRTEEKLFLVTAYHVLFDLQNKLKSKKLKLTSYDRDQLILDPIEMLVDLTKATIKKRKNKDIALIELADITDEKTPMQLKSFVKKISVRDSVIVVVPPKKLKSFKDVLVSNEAFILGYPSSLGSSKQIDRRRPLLRKGIVAGKNIKEETIILDCPVYQGNSGGLALEVESNAKTRNFKVIGVVAQFVPFVEEFKSKQLGYVNVSIQNSGYSVVIPIDTIIDLTKK